MSLCFVCYFPTDVISYQRWCAIGNIKPNLFGVMANQTVPNPDVIGQANSTSSVQQMNPAKTEVTPSLPNISPPPRKLSLKHAASSSNMASNTLIKPQSANVRGAAITLKPHVIQHLHPTTTPPAMCQPRWTVHSNALYLRQMSPAKVNPENSYQKPETTIHHHSGQNPTTIVTPHNPVLPRFPPWDSILPHQMPFFPLPLSVPMPRWDTSPTSFQSLPEQDEPYDLSMPKKRKHDVESQSRVITKRNLDTSVTLVKSVNNPSDTILPHMTPKHFGPLTPGVINSAPNSIAKEEPHRSISIPSFSSDPRNVSNGYPAQLPPLFNLPPHLLRPPAQLSANFPANISLNYDELLRSVSASTSTVPPVSLPSGSLGGPMEPQ